MISATDFQEFKEHFIAEEQEIKGKLDFTESEIRLKEKQIQTFLDWTENLDSGFDNPEMEQVMIDELIDKIYINDDKSIEVVFKCKDMMEEVIDIVGE